MLLEKEVTNLVNAIEETNEFKKFKRAKANLEKHKDLKEEIELFQKKQMELYNMNRQGKESNNLAAEVNMSFNKLSQIPEVNKLLVSGKAFNDMMLSIYKDINSLLDTKFLK